MMKTEKVVAYKAFDEDMSCRGFNYEVGQTYEHDGTVEMCGSGFHACTVPFNCWNYYPGSVTFARVVYSDGIVALHGDDLAVAAMQGYSKVVGAKITIEAKLELSDWIRAQTEAVLALCKSAKGALVSKQEECAAATGDNGHAAATGQRGHAAATGYGGHAAATGDNGHAAATGYRGHAAATGYRGHAAATGYNGHAAATGYRGHAAATGDSGHAAATGDSGHAAATGKNAIAAALGYGGTAQAGDDGWVVLAAYDDEGNAACVKAAKVGGPEGIEPGVAYRLTADGTFVEA
jgi:hypothetical protein